MGTSKWVVECNRYFIESGEVNSKGKVKLIPVTVRKMHIHGDFVFTDYYRITLVRRGGKTWYSVYLRKKPKRPFWDKTPIKAEECKMVKDASYTREQFVSWLKHFVSNPLGAVVELETAEPENLAA